MDFGTILRIVLVVLVVLFLYSRLKPAKGLKTLKAGEFQSELDKKGLLIDVREPSEFKAGYISSAKNIPLSQLQGRMGELPQGKRILLYCRSGMRSKMAARMLLKHGYNDLAHLRGGLGGWNGKLTR